MTARTLGPPLWALTLALPAAALTAMALRPIWLDYPARVWAGALFLLILASLAGRGAVWLWGLTAALLELTMLAWLFLEA